MGIPPIMVVSWIFNILMLSVFLLNNYVKMLGWILITLATITALVSYSLARCCSPLTSLQHRYWTNHLHNERELFEQAAAQHSRLLILQRIKKLFGVIPGNEDVRHIHIPSCRDWREMSVPSGTPQSSTFYSHSIVNRLYGNGRWYIISQPPSPPSPY